MFLVGFDGFFWEISLQQISFLVGQFFNHGVNNPFWILGLINGAVEYESAEMVVSTIPLTHW